MEKSVVQRSITGAATMCLIEAARARARSEGQAVVVAIVDTTGSLVGFVAEHGAPRISHAVARDKAFTAAMTGMSSQAWKELMDTMPAHEREIAARAEGHVGTEGGYPIFDAGERIGGIGVSGAATGELDAIIARAAIAALDAER